MDDEEEYPREAGGEVQPADGDTITDSNGDVYRYNAETGRWEGVGDTRYEYIEDRQDLDWDATSPEGRDDKKYGPERRGFYLEVPDGRGGTMRVFNPRATDPRRTAPGPGRGRSAAGYGRPGGLFDADPGDFWWSPDWDSDLQYDWRQKAEEDLTKEGEILDWLGLSDQEKEHLERRRQQYHDALWRRLRDTAPGAEELFWESEEEREKDYWGSLLGDPSRFEEDSVERQLQVHALNEMARLYNEGGYTDADRAMQAANRQMVAQQMGAANQAALQQARARGMTGSGALLAQQGANTQGMANAQMQQDAQMQQAAMQRALSALGAFQSGANTMRNQEQARRSALDDFNRGNMDWRRERETRNTQARSQTNQNRSTAQQQAWQNRAQATQGLTQRAGVSSSPSGLGATILGASGQVLEAVTS